MIFTQSVFVVYLSVILLLYFITRKNHTLNKWILLVGSYLFYGWATPYFSILLFISSVIDFYCALKIFNAKSDRIARTWMLAGVISSLSILAYFKYAFFFAQSIGAVTNYEINQELQFLVNVALPSGISFYTFQSMTYLIDVYRKKIKPTNSLTTYLLFVSYFPQLVAGPIERASRLLPQFFSVRPISKKDIADGARLILAGYLMKIIVADNLSIFVDQVYGAPADYLAPAIAVATIFFGFQIYCDFAGYSYIAIGIAKLMGIHIMRNFRTPYFATTLPDFWHRWHISLSTFFQDYVYFPLGGSRHSLFITCRNIAIVFLLSGLWHGANWTFVSWGLYHGLGLIGVVLLTSILKRRNIATNNLPTVVLSVIATQFFVFYGWILFRAQSLGDAGLMMSRLLDPRSYSGDQAHIISTLYPTMGILVCFILLDYLQMRRRHLLDVDHLPPMMRFLCYAAALLAIPLLGSGAETQFIYFRF